MARADASDESDGTGGTEASVRGAAPGGGEAPSPVLITSASGEPLAFEAAMARLEAVVDRLEGGELELEAALASFEEGVRLTRHCAEQLDAAERRIELLLQDGEDWVARPFGQEVADVQTDARSDEEEESDEEPDEEGWED